MDYEALVQQLIQLLHRAEIPDMLVGGLAANDWGLPRATFDVDIVLTLRQQDVGELVQPLQKLGFDLRSDIVRHILRIGNRFMTRSPKIEFRIDFWIPKTRYEQDAFERRRRGNIFGKPCWLIAPEDLVLMKLLAGRGKDIDDAIGVAERQQEKLDWGYVTSWAKQLGLTDRLKRVRTRRG